MRKALPQFWRYLEEELDAILGGHRLDDTRRDYGVSLADVDTEGASWFASYPGEHDRADRKLARKEER